MQSSKYKQKLQQEVNAARDTNNILKSRVNQLEKQVSSLQAESIAHLNARLAEVSMYINYCYKKKHSCRGLYNLEKIFKKIV